MKKISVVLPCLNESKNLNGLIPEIIENIPKSFDYEVICVDDGSNDDTISVIKKFANKNPKVKGICFHRRFGHQAALMAGIEKATGDAVITMDADFQHPPKIIPEMISLWQKDHDLVIPVKKTSSYSGIINNLERRLGYQIWKYISDGIIIPGGSNFRLMDSSIVKFLTKSPEHEIFFRGLTNTAAKSIATIPYKVGVRKYGKSSYNFAINRNLFITGLISFSIKPLRIASYLGLLLGVSSFIFLVVDVLQALIVGRMIISGYLTIVLLMMILNGFIIFYLGILGEYIGVIFKEVKKRPSFIIDKKINL